MLDRYTTGPLSGRLVTRPAHPGTTDYSRRTLPRIGLCKPGGQTVLRRLLASLSRWLGHLAGRFRSRSGGAIGAMGRTEITEAHYRCATGGSAVREAALLPSSFSPSCSCAAISGRRAGVTWVRRPPLPVIVSRRGLEPRTN